jgi:hypothetical protein
MAETNPWHSVWRPLAEVVDDLPFAVCDARTGSSTDLLEVEFINSDYVRRSFMVKHMLDLGYVLLEYHIGANTQHTNILLPPWPSKSNMYEHGMDD